MSKTTNIVVASLSMALAVSVVSAVHYRDQREQARLQLEVSRDLPDPDELIPPPAPVNHSAPKPRPVEEISVIRDDGPLKDRIRELEGLLAERDAMIASLRQASSNRTADAGQNRIRQDFGGAGRTNDAARRAEFEKRRQEVQQTVQNAFAKKANFLLERDTSKMSETEKKEYSQMVSLLDETWKLTAQMQAELPRDQRHQLMHNIGENVATLEPMLATERQREIRDLGLSLGYSETEAANFVSYMNEIIEVTSVNNMFPQFRNRQGGRDNPRPAQPPTP